MRHVTAILVTTVLATSLAAVPAAVAAPASSPAAAPRVSRPVRPAGPPKFLPPAAAKSAALARGRILPTTPHVGSPRLDARTQFLRPARNGTVQVTVSGTEAEVSAQVRKLGGRVLVSVDGRSSVTVAKTKLGTLSSAPGVSAVTVSPKAYVDVAPGPSQGIAASGANTWFTSDSGAGVSIAIVDAGFSDLANQVSLGHLAADQANRVTNENCVNGSNTASIDTTQHGTAVAEIVHQMAPDATIYLYCVADAVGFSAAEQAIEGIPAIKIVNSSLGFPGDSRGDGTGAPGSAAATVERARKAGILWIQSAGNNGEDHWSGDLLRDPSSGLIELDGTNNDTDQVDVPNGGSADLILQWDQWPVSSAPLTLTAVAHLCPTTTCSTAPYAKQSISQTGGTSPVLDLPVTNTSGTDEVWVISIGSLSSLPSVRYDLSYWGDVSQSYLASLAPARAAAGSMAEPASSPYAFAVGAADVGADGRQLGTLEPFSSQGPTIDGRIKPDITGWDGVSSYLSQFNTGFYGTSAAAPHVAGAAALVAAANPSMGAAQLEYFLEQRAGTSQPANPPSNATGYGLLTLGSRAGVAPPAGARYTPIAPTRILDTRTTTGGHRAPLGATGTVTVTVPGLPSDATAVAINLTGVGAAGTTFLSAYPGGAAWPGTSNLNLARTDPTAAVFAVVSVRNGAITIRNNAAMANVVVDELGYFGTGSEPGKYDALQSPTRVLDTRTTTGGHRGQLGNGQNLTVDPAAPPGASAAVVNVTVTAVRSVGFVSAAPACTFASSTLNYGGYTRANLAIVKLNAAGTFCIVNRGAATNVVVDVVGYIGSTGPPYVGQYVALPSPQRIVDTRTGNGGSAGGLSSKALGAGSATAFGGSSVGVVPASATALLAGVAEATTSSGGYLTLYPGSTMPASPTSSLNFTPGRTVPNAAIVGLSGQQFGIYNRLGQTQVVVDLFGYFD